MRDGLINCVRAISLMLEAEVNRADSWEEMMALKYGRTIIMSFTWSWLLSLLIFVLRTSIFILTHAFDTLMSSLSGLPKHWFSFLVYMFITLRLSSTSLL